MSILIFINMKFTCDSCNYETDIKSNYARHLKTIKHAKNAGEITKKKVYKCEHDECTYETTDCSNFKKHQKVHEKKGKKARDELIEDCVQLKGKLKRLNKKIEVTEDKETKKFLKEYISILAKDCNKLVKQIESAPVIEKTEEPVEEPKEVPKEVPKKTRKAKVVEVKEEKEEYGRVVKTQSKEVSIAKINGYLEELTNLGLDPTERFCIPDSFDDYEASYVEGLCAQLAELFHHDENAREELNEWIERLNLEK